MAAKVIYSCYKFEFLLKCNRILIWLLLEVLENGTVYFRFFG